MAARRPRKQTIGNFAQHQRRHDRNVPLPSDRHAPWQSPASTSRTGRVGHERESVAAVDVAISAFGRLDVLVNNAGFGETRPFEEVSSDDFRRVVETNFFGVVNLTRAALPVMRQQRSGHIIQISSVGGRSALAGNAAYIASKWAVGGFAETVALESAPFGVKVTALEPGGMRTNWGNFPSV
jgi:NAD(P)-dependent dehydrogenase (short-subunit alcohol dehydrogenase family)